MLSDLRAPEFDAASASIAVCQFQTLARTATNAIDNGRTTKSVGMVGCAHRRSGIPTPSCLLQWFVDTTPYPSLGAATDRLTVG